MLGQGQAARLATEDLLELLVDDLDNLLGRVQRLRDDDAVGALLDALDDGAHDGQGDVRLEQRETDFACGGVDVLLSEAALATQPLEGT